jgi:hypothetical protein
LAGLVLELQSDALNKEVRCSDLLRKALVVSRKLGIDSIEGWIQYELNGFPLKCDAIPDYREIHGLIKIWNPYHGWQPLNFGDPKQAERLSTRRIMQPVGELDALLENKGSRDLQVPFPQHIVNTLMKGMSVPLQPTLHVSHTEIVGILDAVRNTVLEWALELEKKGVVGEGMTFSKKEKQTAGQVFNKITYNIGSMENSQLQQDSPGASQIFNVGADSSQLIEFVSKIKASVKELGLDSDSEKELNSEILTIEIQSKSPKPKSNIIFESLKTIRSVLEGAAGSVVATPFLAQLGNFL